MAADRLCALTFAGEILCWGSTASEALAGRPVASVTKVPGTVDLVMTRNYLCLQAADRSVSCASFMPREAVPGTFRPLRGATRVSAITISGDGDSFCLLRSSRSALCFTDSFRKADVAKLYRAETPRGLRPVAATRTFANTCFVDRSGRVRCTGNDPFDPMAAQGAGAPIKERDRNRYRVVPGIKDATGLSSGSALCVIRRGGRLTCVNPNDATPQRRSGASGAGNASLVRGIDDVREVVDTYGTTCAIRSDGAVWCWGLGYAGHGPTFSVTPVAVEGLTDATSISVGDQHSCAIRSGGDVACWGAANAGSIDARFSTTATQVDGIEGATAVAATSRGTCALTTGEALRCWGPIGFGAMKPIKPFTVARAESATGEPVGLSGSCLRLDARIDCLELQRPRGTRKHRSTRPTGTLVTQPGLSQVAQVVDDGFVRCAIHVDRTVTCAGTGWLAPQSDRTSVAAGPTSMPGLTGVVQLSSGRGGACAVIQGGRVTCWAGADPVFDGSYSAPLPAAGSPGHVIPGIEDAGRAWSGPPDPSAVLGRRSIRRSPPAHRRRRPETTRGTTCPVSRTPRRSAQAKATRAC
jgi:hypothetical protein